MLPWEGGTKEVMQAPQENQKIVNESQVLSFGLFALLELGYGLCSLTRKLEASSQLVSLNNLGSSLPPRACHMFALRFLVVAKVQL